VGARVWPSHLVGRPDPPLEHAGEGERPLRPDDPHRQRIQHWIALACAGAFLLHAVNYLYFFVDDEGIPYVFAQSLLNGRGLSYNSFEGRVEGYSDFLHVLLATAILGATRLLHLDKLTVFLIHGAWSLFCGVAIVWTVAAMLRSIPHVRGPGFVAGMAFLILAGPLAVWSCSSLETAAFALLVTLLTSLTIVSPPEGGRRWQSAACAITTLLMRADGFVYVGVVLCSAMIVAARERRNEILRSVVLPCAVVFIAYHTWRIWYFGQWLPAPLAAKVLYKLILRQDLLVKAPARDYASAFLAQYGAIPLIVLSLGSVAWTRSRAVIGCALAAVILTAYLAVVGDWMFGFRFFVAVLPFIAVLVAHTVSAVASRWRPAVGWVLASACVVWFGQVAWTFFRSYERSERKESWLAHPSLDPARRFARYYSLLQQARPLLRRGTRTAYNQAGLLPFLLDLDNIDTLGLCSRYYADLPVTDLFMTEVGRYSPPADKPVMDASKAYLLYRRPAFLIYPEDLLRSANFDRIPRTMLGDAYRVVFRDESRRNVVYQRTTPENEPFRVDARDFAENLAHVTHVTRAAVNGGVLPRSRLTTALRYLREGTDRIEATHGYTADVTFGDEDELVFALYVDELRANHPVTVALALFDGTGDTVRHTRIELAGGERRRIYERLADTVRARRLRVDITNSGTEAATLTVSDIRVMGQSRRLAAFVARTLRFPPP